MIDDLIYGWIANVIFIIAQLSQILHTYKVKKTNDISYILQFMWLSGNILYTIYGYINNSNVIFYGNLITSITTLINIFQKIYYDNINKRSTYLEII